MTATNDIKVKKCGIRFTPPRLVLVYESDSTSEKLKIYNMPIRNFKACSDVSFVTKDLKSRHKLHLESVSSSTVEKMLRILQEHLRGKSLDDCVGIVQKEFSVDPDEDLNKLTDDDIRRKKDIMDETFTKHQVKPSDPEFVYDKEIDFDKAEKVESGWDEELEEEEDDFWK